MASVETQKARKYKPSTAVTQGMEEFYKVEAMKIYYGNQVNQMSSYDIIRFCLESLFDEEVKDNPNIEEIRKQLEEIISS